MNELLDTWRRLNEIGAGRSDWMAPEPPATAEAIAAAEKKLKRPFPPAIAALLRLSRTWAWREEGYDAVTFLPPEEIVAETLRPRDPAMVLSVEDATSSRVVAKVYGPGRTTFARSDYFFFQIDDEPPPGGRPGQIVSIDFEEGLVDVVAESIEAFLARGLACMKAQLEGGFPQLVPSDPRAQAAVAAIVVPPPDVSTLPPRVPAPERPPLRQPKAKDPLGATLLGIDAWLHANLPAGAKRFKPGATTKKIRQFLSAYGYALPEGLFPLFATFNGQSPQRIPLLPCPLQRCSGLLLGDYEDVARGRDNYQGLRRVLFAKAGRVFAADPAGVKSGLWRDKWWPIASSVREDPIHRVTLFVDYDPAPGGSDGQVVLDFVLNSDHRPEHGERRIIAPSVQAYFDALLADMEGGKFEYREDKGLAWKI